MTHKLTSSSSELIEFSKILSHPARVEIIQALAKKKDQSCSELVKLLPLSQATVSQHLKDLVNSTLICRKQVGVRSIYCLEWNSLEKMFYLFGSLEEKLFQQRPKRNCC